MILHKTIITKNLSKCMLKENPCFSSKEGLLNKSISVKKRGKNTPARY
ncbi:hypothetical protein STRMA_1006 [Streptococcus macacae NCTC 11558]|uniref:Uncharacterized protein n=1 Tax=Streptococcus macacae NCTC 11558 TaxID=764298 RepID=G5JWN3_9STRE|nr:hypothetical protein STRMA_1006 [Streptococcus macacae NCTC 11558]